MSVAGNYQESNGTAHSYLNTASYDYSAINSFSVLTISPIHAVNLSAPPAGEDSEEFFLSNVSSQNVILGDLTFSSSIAGLTRATTIPDTVVCNNGSTIGGFKSCTVKMVYSPLIADTGKSTNFQIPVASIGGAAITDTTHIVLTSVVSATGAGGNAAISVNVATSGAGVDNNITDGADGTTATPYQFILSNGHFIDFTYTFTNAVGASPAMHFNVATSSLPVQAEIVDGTDCPVGSEIGNLAAGDSCNVVVRVPRASALAAGLITDAATTSVTLPYSWTDNNGVNTEANTANTRSAIIRTGWTSGLTATAAGRFLDDGTGYEVRVNASITGIAANSGVTYPIRVTPVFAGATNIVSCDITGTGDTPNECPSTFRLPTSIPQGTYSVVVRLTAGTGATASTQQTTATLNVIRGMMFLSAPLTTLAFEGYGAADALCNTDTNRPVGYRGLSYKAMLPARTDSIFVTGRDYYSNNNLNGTTPRKVATANNTQYLSTANLENAISSTANTFIAIGHYTGNATTATGANCNDWTTNLATVNFVQGNVSQTTSIWRGAAEGNLSACNSVTHRLLCVAQ